MKNNILFYVFIIVIIYILYHNNYEKFNNSNNSNKYITEKCWDLSNLDSILVYKTLLPKIRLGRKHDGGYVIIDNLTYDYYISCGIETDISFDEEFLRKYPSINGIGIDGSINGFPYELNRFSFVKKYIGAKNDSNTTNLTDYIKNYNNIFLKMDIEEWEFDWLESISIDTLKKFKQITMEVHFNNLTTGKYTIDEKLKILDKFNQTHILVHAHPNNHGDSYICEDIILPHGIEFTYIRKDLQNNIGLSEDSIPSKYDIINTTLKPDIYLSGYPYSI